MRYLGKLRGMGFITCSGRDIGRASYDIDGFAVRPKEIAGSGEIRLKAADLDQVFGRSGVGLRTDDGRLLDLRFSDKSRAEGSSVAHVEVSGALPSATDVWTS